MPQSFADRMRARGIEPVQPELTNPEYVEIEAQATDPALRPEGVKGFTKPKTFAERMKLRGVEPVTPTAPVSESQTPAEDSMEPTPEKRTTPSEASERLEALTLEGRKLRDNPLDDPEQQETLQEDWLKRWKTHHNDEREKVLEKALVGSGFIPANYKNLGQAARRADEAQNQFGGTILASAQRLFNNDAGANQTVAAGKMLNEYNNLLDRDSLLGEKYGPMFGNIAASLGGSTISAVTTGGLVGVAGMVGLDEFNQGYHDTQNLPEDERWRHAASRSVIGTSVTLAGGALAKKLGVSSGDSIIPMVGRTAERLFSRTGLSKAVTAAVLEGGEEAVQSLLNSAENAWAGLTSSQTWESVVDNMLSSFTTGALVGTITEVSPHAGRFVPKAAHYKNLIEGWTNRLPKSKDGEQASQDDASQGFVESNDGQPISRKALDDNMKALAELEAESKERYESGDNVELRHLHNERLDVKDHARKELTEAKKRRAVWLSSGLKPDSPKVRNLDGRIQILADHKADIDTKVTESEAQLAEWKNEYEGIYKQEQEYIAEELDRLSKMKEQPDVAEKIATKAEEVTAEGTPTKPELKNQRDAVKKEAAVDATKKGEEAAAEVALKGAPKVQGDTTTTETAVFDDMKAAMLGARQKDTKFMRKFLGLDTVEKRASLSTDENFRIAAEKGYDKEAVNLAQSVLDGDKKILDSVELAGVQKRFVDNMQQIVQNTEYLAKNGETLSDTALDARNKQVEALLEEVDTLTEAWIASSSEAGAALQAQQRVYGYVYSAQRGITKARRLKGSKLTKEEIVEFQRLADVVAEAGKLKAAFEPGTKDYDQADFELYEAELDFKAAIKNAEPQNKWLKGIERINAFGMARTLSGDLPPIGRQGFRKLTTTNPKESYKDAKRFFEVLFSGNANEAAMKQFVVERSLREMENYKTLTRDFNVPTVDGNSDYSQVEGSALQRMRGAFSDTKTFKAFNKLTKNYNKWSLKQFENAYSTWLNHLRITTADTVYRANEHLLELPDGKAQMQTLINEAMNGTGHVGDVGNSPAVGKAMTIGLTAPRWMLSRIALPAKGVYHAINASARGVIPGAKRSHVSEQITRQNAKSVIGAGIVSAALEGAAGVMFGFENVSVDRNPLSPTFGMMTVMGRTTDITGGTGFAIRNMVKGLKGAYEISQGDNKEKDVDAAKAVGGILTSRSSPFARHAGYTLQSGKPVGADEKMALGEYAIRNLTFLSWQGTVEAGIDEGPVSALYNGAAENLGFSNFKMKKKKRKKRK